MATENLWAHFFKPEVRKQGEDLLLVPGVFKLTQATDTQIEAFLRQSLPVRVTFRANAIASQTFTATCSCPSFLKGQFCKHLWATLLLVQKNSPDFLSEKKDIERAQPLASSSATSGAISGVSAKNKTAQQISKEETLKAKQAAYRKSQYQIQKQKHKQGPKTQLNTQLKTRPKKAGLPISLPEQVSDACAYFSVNGFALEEQLEIDILRNAKKQLSRVFHPDKGGTHEEILELNRNFEILSTYILENI